MASELEDIKMIALLKEQQEEGLQMLVFHYHAHIQFVLKQQLPKTYASDFDDLENEIYYKIWQKIHLYQSEKSQFKTWLETITKNHCLDYLRKKKREATFIPVETLQNDLASDLPLSQDDFYTLIFSLSPVDQTIFYQYYYDERSISEISQLTKIKEKNIYNRLSRGRKKLAKILKKGGI